MPRPNLAVDASRAFGRIRTGTEWYSFELINALAKLPDRPKLILYGREPDPRVCLATGDEYHQIRRRRLWTHLGLSVALLRDRPDALLVPSHVNPAVHPRASVVTIHDLGYKHEPAAHPGSARLMLDIATRWNYRSARRIIAVSQQTRDDLVAYYGADRGKITVIHSGVSTDRFFPTSPERVIAEHGLRQPYVLFLSTVQPRKNVTRLVEAFESIERTDLSLVIAGKRGWLSDEIEHRIRTSSVRDRIKRLGFVPDEHVPALYSGAAVFALPSLYEGFGMGILEAMACGCPVVTSNRSSMPEIAGGAAVLIDPTDVASIRIGIERALDPAERDLLVNSGFRRAATLKWERTATETLGVVEGSIRTRGTSGATHTRR